MRTISAAGMQALFAESSEEIVLPLVTITHPDYPGTSRLVANMTDISYGGNTYTALPFEFVLAADTQDAVPVAKIRFDNVSRDLVALLRSVTTPATMQVEIIRIPATGPYVSEVGPLTYSLRNVSITATVVECTLAYETDFLNEPACRKRFDSIQAPGLFA